MPFDHIQTEDLDPWLITWNLDTTTLDILKKYGEVLEVPARANIFSEGDVSDAMYLVLHGMVLILKKDSHGHEQTVSIVVEGQSFGEVSLLVDRERRATAAAGIDSRLLKITPQALNKLEEDNVQVALTIYKALARSFADQWIHTVTQS